MANVAWIALGGALGAVLRFAVSGLAGRIGGDGFPWGTLVVNVLGSFVAGFLWAFMSHKMGHQRFHSLVFIGLLGAFTTFSAYSIESLQLFQAERWAAAVLNVLANNIGALAAVGLGYVLALWVNALAAQS